MAAGTCAISPRLVAVPGLQPRRDLRPGTPAAATDITIVKVLGFFIDECSGNDVIGYLMTYPAVAAQRHRASTPGAAFVVSIALVR